MERTGVLRDIPLIDPVPIKDLLATAPSAFAALNGFVPTEDAACFLLAGCHKDLSKGFAGPLYDQGSGRFQEGSRSVVTDAQIRNYPGKRQASTY